MNSTLKTTEPPVAANEGRAEAASPRVRPDITLVPPPPPGLKAKQLFQEAREVSLEHLRSLEAAIAAVRELSDAIVDGGALYGPGLHDFARRLTEDLFWRSKMLAVLSQRQGASS